MICMGKGRWCFGGPLARLETQARLRKVIWGEGPLLATIEKKAREVMGKEGASGTWLWGRVRTS